jgi:hypothetical protein
MALCACASSSSLSILSSQSPPRPRVSSSSPPLLSLSPIDKTLSQIHSSGVIACLRANRSLSQTFMLCSSTATFFFFFFFFVYFVCNLLFKFFFR